jgi:hypothetical protein
MEIVVFITRSESGSFWYEIVIYRRGAAELGNAIECQGDTFAPCDEQLFSSLCINNHLIVKKLDCIILRIS